MSDAMAMTVSRPKIHRLPKQKPAPRHRLAAAVVSYGAAAKLVFTLSSLALALLLVGLIANRFVPPSLFDQEAQSRPVVLTGPAIFEASPAAGGTPRQKAIVIKGQKEMIVGQLTKISPSSAPASEVTARSEVDNRKGRELLSIVNQY